jgi:hypothetical protein
VIRRDTAVSGSGELVSYGVQFVVFGFRGGGGPQLGTTAAIAEAKVIEAQRAEAPERWRMAVSPRLCGPRSVRSSGEKRDVCFLAHLRTSPRARFRACRVA